MPNGETLNLNANDKRGVSDENFSLQLCLINSTGAAEFWLPVKQGTVNWEAVFILKVTKKCPVFLSPALSLKRKKIYI